MPTKTTALCAAILALAAFAPVTTVDAHACAGDQDCDPCEDDARNHFHWGTDHVTPCVTADMTAVQDVVDRVMQGGFLP